VLCGDKNLGRTEMQVLGTLQGKALEGLSAALNSAGAAGFRLCDRGSLVGLHNGLPGRSGCTGCRQWA
jgi:hypothetical protein